MSQEIIEAEVSGVPNLPALNDDAILQVAEQAEKRIEAVTKIKTLALKVTNAIDWVDMGGKPYLQVSGAEKIARLFGISWRIGEPQIDISGDGHFLYEYKGYFSLGGVTIEAIGTRSSKDSFFSRAKGRDIPPSDIDRGDVKKAAYTNCIGNGVTRLLGIRNLTWDEIKKSGLDTSKSNKVEYAERGKKSEEQKTSDKSAASSLIAELNSRCMGEREAMADLLERASYYEQNGKEYSMKLDKLEGNDPYSEKWCSKVLAKVKEMLDKGAE